jgi:acetate kinase
MLRRVLVLNAGSSSLKASVLDDDSVAPAAESTASWTDPRDEAGTLRRSLDLLARDQVAPRSIEAVGHRIVHGGARFTAPAVVDDDVIAAISGLSALAPLHNPLALAILGAAREAFPGIPHVACFDTAFHATLDEASYVYALPFEWFTKWGYRRFGFHGLSVAWAVRRAGELLERPVAGLGLVVAHLGAGCSVTAVWQGQSVATSMGMTPLEGLVMATRVGSVDPGVLLAAMRDHAIDVATLETTLDRESGLLGVSGRTGDMRELLEAEASDERAALAIEIFVRSAGAGIAAAATALPRLDAIAFSGGIGENAEVIRARIAQRLAPLGVGVLPRDRAERDTVLVREPVAVLRIKAREDLTIAGQVRDLLR